MAVVRKTPKAYVLSFIIPRVEGLSSEEADTTASVFSPDTLSSCSQETNANRMQIKNNRFVFIRLILNYSAPDPFSVGSDAQSSVPTLPPSIMISVVSLIVVAYHRQGFVDGHSFVITSTILIGIPPLISNRTTWRFPAINSPRSVCGTITLNSRSSMVKVSFNPDARV